MSFFKYTITGIFLFIVTVIFSFILDYSNSLTVNRHQLFGELSIQYKKGSTTGSIIYKNKIIANTDDSSKWFIQRPYFYGVFTINNETSFIIYNCNTGVIEFSKSLSEYNQKLRKITVENYKFEYGEGMLELNNGRKFFGRCGDYS